MIKKGVTTIRKVGLGSFLRKTFDYFVLPLITLPYSLIKISKLNKSTLDLNDSIDFVYDHCGGILKPAQVRGELYLLLKLVEERKPGIVMEIGTARGGSLFLLSRVLPDNAVIISIDLPWGKFGGGYPPWKLPLYKKFARGNQQIHFIREDSHSEITYERVKKILKGKSIDFLFIDGDHSYEGVKRDYELYGGLVRGNGLIAFHDILPHSVDQECEVDKFWEEVKREEKFIEFIENPDQGWAGIGGIIRKI